MKGEESVGPWMPVYISDLFIDTDHLSIEEFGAYLRLLLQMWARGGVLPNDPERLARLARIDRATFDRVWPVVGKFFHATPEGELTQKRLAHELARARLVRTSALEKAQKGGKAAAAKRKQLRLGIEPEAVPEAHPEAVPEALLRNAQSHFTDPDPGLSAGSFSGLLRLFSAIWEERYCESYMPTPQDRSNLGRLLKGFRDKAAIEAYPWEATFRNYLLDMSPWAAGEKRHSLTNFCTGGGLNKYRVSDPTLGFSQREVRSIQAGAKFDEVMSAFDGGGGPNGRAR